MEREGRAHRFLRCVSCGSLSLEQALAFEEVEAAHAAGRYHGEARAKFPTALEAALAVLERRRAAWLARTLKAGARVLDVGCGRGVMAAALQGRGFDVAVTELNAEAAAGAVRRGVRKVLTGPGALDGLPAGSLDAVSLFHSLEHLREPRAALARLAGLLVPRGQLFVEVPLLSRVARAFGAAWFHLDPPRHTVLFTREGLLAAAGAAGLGLREEHRFSLEFSAPSLFLSTLGLRAGSDGLYASAHVTAAGGARRAAAAAAIVAGSALALVPAALLTAAGEGDILRARFEVAPR